jgi:hypothetical protein
MQFNLFGIGVVALLQFLPIQYASCESPATPSARIGDTLLKLPSKTLGGDQYWADEFIHGGWRIQRNVFSGHYRLLDEQDHRRMVGDYWQCRIAFEKCLVAGEIPPMKPEAVILLHGLLRSRDTMDPIADYFKQQTNWEVINFTYPSSQGSVGEHATALDKVLFRLDKNVTKIHFVCHSLGNIVVRHWMHDTQQKRHAPDARLGRMVMLGPPNSGAQFAQRLEKTPLFGLVTGDSGKQLARDWHMLQDKICIPPCEFGIMAGNQGINPLIPGDNDLCVSVEETKLAGAADFRVLPLNHSTLRTSDTVHEFTLKFLQHGCFESPEKCQPLPAN